MTTRQAIKSLLEKQRSKCEKSLSFYSEIERKTPVADQWKYSKENPFYDDLNGLIAKEIISPVIILETIIQTLDEYLLAVSRFSDREWAAFLLGLGLNWLPVEYWGIAQLTEYQGKIQKSASFYSDLTAKIPREDQWKFTKEGVFDLPDIIPPDALSPREVLQIANDINSSMLSALSSRAF